MDFEITYPKPARRSVFMHYLRYICGWVFLVAAPTVLVINWQLGGKWWSIVAIWAMYMIWAIGLKQPLVEYNLIGQGVRLLITTGILLVLIDVFLYPGWALLVVPIFIFGSLIVLGILFFVNISKQRHNIMPLIWVTVASIISSAIALFVFSESSWQMIVLGAVAAALLISSIVILRMQFLVEFKKRFHIK